ASNQQWALFVGGDVLGTRGPTPADLAKAGARVRGAAFVGLVEHMDLSLCLFAETFLARSQADDLCAGGSSPRKQRENVGRRPVVRSDALDALLARHNRYDAALYDLATQDFRRRVRRSTRAAAAMTDR
ncbi:MAG: hypothetical protein AAFV01_17760, partial [Bacteroidota bacterium]